MLTALSTSSVYIETLQNDHWELPFDRWFVERDSKPICNYPKDAPLKGCTDQHAKSQNTYWVGNGELFRIDTIRTLSQNRKCGFTLNFIEMYVRLGLRFNMFKCIVPQRINVICKSFRH